MNIAHTSFTMHVSIAQDILAALHAMLFWHGYYSHICLNEIRYQHANLMYTNRYRTPGASSIQRMHIDFNGDALAANLYQD